VYDYLIVGVGCLCAGYFFGAFVVSAKVQRFFKKLPKELTAQLKEIYKNA
jgi:hypothetical protein